MFCTSIAACVSPPSDGRRYEDYPEQDIAAAREHLQRRVDEKGDAIEERMKQLAASADIVEVRAAIKEFAESSDRFAIRVAELRRAASALVAEISAVMKEARRAVHPQEIAAVLERAEAFEEVVVERRALLTRQRELTQAATKELQALTATNDFAVVQKGVMKYVDWIDFDEGTRRAYGQVHEHWEKLLDGVRAKLRELCSEDDPRAITATLKEMEGFNWKGYEAREGVESVSEIIDAAEARCEALTSACRGAMEKMAANEEASVREIDEMMARYEGWANVGEQRGMLKKALEARPAPSLQKPPASISYWDHHMLC